MKVRRLEKEESPAIKPQRYTTIRKLGTEGRTKETENEVKYLEDDEEIKEEQHDIEGEDNMIEEEWDCSESETGDKFSSSTSSSLTLNVEQKKLKLHSPSSSGVEVDQLCTNRKENQKQTLLNSLAFETACCK